MLGITSLGYSYVVCDVNSGTEGLQVDSEKETKQKTGVSKVVLKVAVKTS